MPRTLKPILLTLNRLPQVRMRRRTLRYPVNIMLPTVIPRSNTLPELSFQPVDGNTGIPAGYESDDSWDNDSHTHKHTHTHNIVLLLTLHTWNNRPHRGREQHQRQNNNIPVQTGNAPYSRPWDNQPYGRHTRSQQALRARAYRKLQCRYPIQ